MAAAHRRAPASRSLRASPAGSGKRSGSLGFAEVGLTTYGVIPRGDRCRRVLGMDIDLALSEIPAARRACGSRDLTALYRALKAAGVSHRGAIVQQPATLYRTEQDNKWYISEHETETC